MTWELIMTKTGWCFALNQTSTFQFLRQAGHKSSRFWKIPIKMTYCCGLELHLRQVLVTSQMLCRYYWNLKMNGEKNAWIIHFYKNNFKDSNILPHPQSLPMTGKKRMSQTQRKLRKAIQENDEPLLISINLSQVRQGQVSGFPCTLHFSNLLTFTLF